MVNRMVDQMVDQMADQMVANPGIANDFWRHTPTMSQVSSNLTSQSDLARKDEYYMAIAIQQSQLSEPVPSAYCVGAVLERDGLIFVTGYSRELPGNTHAEECCLMKVTSADGRVDAAGCTLYTTMEPCSRRLSGKKSCTSRLIDAGIERVVIAVREPPTFVADCTGSQDLVAAGVKVDFCEKFSAAALAVNKHVLPTNK